MLSRRKWTWTFLKKMKHSENKFVKNIREQIFNPYKNNDVFWNLILFVNEIWSIFPNNWMQLKMNIFHSQEFQKPG